jgi:hypothetical protein
MIAWIVRETGFSPLLVKIVLYLAASGAILYGLRLYGNAQWNKGEASGRKTAVQSIEKAKLREWQVKDAAIAERAATLESDRKIYDAQKTELQGARLSLDARLSQSLNRISKSKEENNATVIAIPGDRLDSAIRSVSGDLAAAGAQ